MCYETLFALVSVGSLLAVFCLLFGRTAAVRPRYVLLFLGLGLLLLLAVSAWSFLEHHASAGYYVVDVHNGVDVYVDGSVGFCPPIYINGGTDARP